MPIKVVAFEDNELLRESLATLFSLDMDYHLVAAFSDANQVIDVIKEHNPDVVLMDIDMPGITGILGVRQIRSINSMMPIIMLTVFDDNQHVFDALSAGASGYLLKKHISTKLFEAINDVLAGGAPMSPCIAKMVINSFQKEVSKNSYALTPREIEILTVLSLGNSYKIIASNLDISIDTVRTHIKKIYEKLHVHSQTEAVSKAITERLV